MDAEKEILAGTEPLKLLEALPEAMILVTEAGKIAYANAQADELFGYARHGLIGMQLMLLIPERFRDRHAADHEEYYRAPVMRPMGGELEVYALHRDGSEFPVEIGLSPAEHISDGETIVLATIRNIAHQVDAISRARDEAAAREREARAMHSAAVQQFEYAFEQTQEYKRAVQHYQLLVRHRIANPLQVIQGMASTLLDEHNLAPEIQLSMLQAIKQAADRLEHTALFASETGSEEEHVLRPTPFEAPGEDGSSTTE